MTEAQLKSFPAFKQLPIYDESDERANSITTVHGAAKYPNIRECLTLAEVQECLKNPRYVPLGGLRATTADGPIAVAYFGERAGANPPSQ
jgi:hypothetical protein